MSTVLDRLETPIFRIAVQNHLDWKERIKEYLLGMLTEEPEFKDHTQCNLGKWLLSNAAENYRVLTSFADLEHWHEQLHRCVGDVLAAKRGRNPKQAEAEFRRLEALSQLVISKIELLDKEYKTSEMESSLALAASFQNTLMHKMDHLVEHVFADFKLINKPFNILSGDFFWLGGSTDRVLMVLGDSVGHGPAASFVSSSFMTILDGIAAYRPGLTLGEFAQEVHDNFSKIAQPLIERYSVSIDFTFLCYEPAHTKLHYTSVNQKALLRHNDQWTTLSGTRVLDNANLTFGEIQVLEIQKGDQVVLFSDGVTTLQTDADGTKLGVKGMMRFVEEYDGIKAGKLAVQFERYAEQLCAQHGQRDDITLIAFQL